MRLHEQRNLLQSRCEATVTEIRNLQRRLQDKTASPFGDGTYSNMVNVDTDVLPALRAVLDILNTDFD
tara:strand:- start:730 stop:933 length:204 start_codon:yes stop_codon:yes gene_type:complete